MTATIEALASRSRRLPSVEAALAALEAVLPAIAAQARRHDREASFPFDSLARLREARIIGLTVPKRLGGGGAGLGAAAIVVERVGQACPATALVLAMSIAKIAQMYRNPAWPAALRDRIGREAVSEGALVNALRVEPELGSPSRGGLPATIARRHGDGWLLSGRKRYSTGAPGLRWMEVYGRTDEDVPRVGVFVVEAGATGIDLVETWDHLGLRASGSHDVVFTDVAVPADQAVGLVAPAQWTGFDPVQAAWNALLVSAVYTGVARAARDWIIAFLRDRVPSGLGAPLSSLPRVQEQVGAIEALLAVNRRLREALATATDSFDAPTPAESGLAKATMAENAVRVVERAVALAGNHGHDRAFALERHWRDVQAARVHVPTEDAAWSAAGRAALQENH